MREIQRSAVSLLSATQDAVPPRAPYDPTPRPACSGLWTAPTSKRPSQTVCHAYILTSDSISYDTVKTTTTVIPATQGSWAGHFGRGSPPHAPAAACQKRSSCISDPQGSQKA